MRPRPTPSRAPRARGPEKFVDVRRGDDMGAGTESQPWKTLAHAVRKLEPGDTLYLREGVYHEHVAPTRSGLPDRPITIRSFPGELAVIDGGVSDFLDRPSDSWEPYPAGAPGEYVSTATFANADSRAVPQHFLPASWEPFWGIEEERPLALGQFADSLVPLHGYRIAADMRATNERWIGGKKEMRDTGIYCGPGLWFNRETGRVHIRLAHHRLDGLGANAYRGETDPRKIPLVIAVGFGQDVVRFTGVRHWVMQELAVRGATGSPLVHIYGCQQIRLDHVSLYGGSPALLINASQEIRVLHSALRGLAAPWTSRAHMKYRGTPSYQVVLQNHQPRNENIELAWCEFTDDHDFAFLRFAKNLQFHHNFVDNFNDDGLECGPKLRDHTLFIHQNRIGRCLIPLTQHEIEKDESPVDHDPRAGVFLYRNVFDQRGGVYSTPPVEPDPTGAFLRGEGHLASDHGSPIWPVMHVYHNAFLRDTPVFRDYFLFGLGAGGLRNNERDVFNNLFLQTAGVPGANLGGVAPDAKLREGGNILWGVASPSTGKPEKPNEPITTESHFAKFRASPLFQRSKESYPNGWTTDDRVVNPILLKWPADKSGPPDLRPAAGSPAVDSGVAVPAAWPDPLRESDGGAPDVGPVPKGVDPWHVGIDGRIPLFGN